MLFRAAILERIRSGEIILAFRRWQRPTVKTGGRLRTAIGELAIDAVAPCRAEDISASDARAAGFADRDALLAELAGRTEGTLYRIALRFVGGDPRAALRARDSFGPDEVAALAARLDRLDRARPWTRPVLDYIASHEGVAAGIIASALGFEKQALKANIRKLKELGLTESLDVGYRLSPRGRALLQVLAD